jgi:hypothetical protein
LKPKPPSLPLKLRSDIDDDIGVID